MNDNEPLKIYLHVVNIQWQVLSAPEEFIPRNKTIAVNKPNNLIRQQVSFSELLKVSDILLQLAGHKMYLLKI